MEVHVVGAGGIGCAVGYALCAAGVSVVFVDADPEKIAWGRAHGVCVDRRPPLPAIFQPFDDWVPRPGALLLLCTKCYDNDVVLQRLPAPVTLIPIQNGFDARLEPYTGAPEGIASFVSECLPHRTHTRITRPGRLHFGGRNGTPTERTGWDIVDCLRPCPLFRVEVVPDILPYKYTKLMYNAAISPLAAAAGIDNGQLLSVPKARQLFFELLRENYQILHDAGVPLGKVGPLHPDTVAAILRRSWVATSLAWAFYPTLRGTYCSMSGDLPRGRTEIDFYNRHLIEVAGDRPCALNRRVYALVQYMERERIPPAPARLDELL
jgi:2-dehydropantoate 2-reductase